MFDRRKGRKKNTRVALDDYSIRTCTNSDRLLVLFFFLYSYVHSMTDEVDDCYLDWCRCYSNWYYEQYQIKTIRTNLSKGISRIKSH